MQRLKIFPSSLIFISRVLLFVLSFSIIYLAYIILLTKYMNKTDLKNGLFIWGDSQMTYGLDYNILEDSLNIKVFSAAYSGAGIYDFLTFVDNVPDSSRVVISFSKPALIRKKEHDFNQSAFNKNAIISLKAYNYSYIEIGKIILDNLKPKKLFYRAEEQKLLPNNDTLNPKESFDLIVNSYNKIPYYFNDKKRLYLSGLDKLRFKGCEINIIVFPFHNTINNIIGDHAVDKILVKAIDTTRMINNIDSMTTITYKENLNSFYDYTHLNERGAKFFTIKLVNILKEKKNTITYFNTFH